MEEKIREAMERIREYEGRMDRALEILRQGDAAADAEEMRGCLKALEAYYTGDAWKEDFALDEAGLLPAGLKRGVLSEDGIDHLLEDGADWLSRVEKR